jgi:hypothetical protein
MVDPRPLLGHLRIKPADSVLAGNKELMLSREALEELIPAAVTHPDSSHLAAATGALVANRRVVLNRLGIEEADALEQGRCPGPAVPPPPPGSPPLDRSGCPSEARRVLITSEARSGGTYWPGQIDEREIGKQLGQWSIRITTWNEHPRSRLTSVDEYVLGRNPSGNWVVVKKINILLLE